jgi:hypothetical protein
MARLCSEAKLGLADSQLALAALAGLEHGDQLASVAALRAILERHRLRDAVRELDDWQTARQAD